MQLLLRLRNMTPEWEIVQKRRLICIISDVFHVGLYTLCKTWCLIECFGLGSGGHELLIALSLHNMKGSKEIKLDSVHIDKPDLLWFSEYTSERTVHIRKYKITQIQISIIFFCDFVLHIYFVLSDWRWRSVEAALWWSKDEHLGGSVPMWPWTLADAGRIVLCHRVRDWTRWPGPHNSNQVILFH